MKLKRFVAMVLLTAMCLSLTVLAASETESAVISLGDITAGATRAYMTYNITWGDVTEGTVFVGAYNGNNRLVGVNLVSVKNGKTSADISVEYPAKPNSFRAFMWNNPTDMVPVSNICEHTPYGAVIENNAVFSVNFSDIASIKVTGSDGVTIEYYADKTTGAKDSFCISSDTTFNVNGEKDAIDVDTLMDRVSSGVFSTECNHTVIDFSLVGDASGDYDYDAAFISVYDNFVVDTYDEADNAIYPNFDSYSLLSQIDYDGGYEVSLADTEGNAVDPATLKSYDVLTMRVTPYNWSTSSDITAIEAVLCRDTVEGIVDEINDDECKYYINDVPYELDPASWLYINLGDEGKFFLDTNGFIVAFYPKSAKLDNYGIIINSDITAGIENSYQVKMYTSEGNLEGIDFASKVRLYSYDGSSTISYNVMDSEAYRYIVSYPTICSYTLDENGDIGAISFANGEMEPTYDSVRSAALVQNNTTTSGKFLVKEQDVKTIDADGTFYMNENTIIMAMYDLADPTSAGADDFMIYSADMVTADQKFSNIGVYDADADNYAGLVFIYDTDISLVNNTVDVTMVKSVSDVLNSDGDATAMVYGINKDGAVSSILDDEIWAALNAGEVYFPTAYAANGDLLK